MSWTESSRRAASPLAADNASGSEGKLYGLWDAIWFGLEDSPVFNAVSRQKLAFTADPLDNVIPSISYAPLPTRLAPNGLSSASGMPSALLQQQQQVAAAAVNGQPQSQRPYEQPSLRYSAGQPASAAAITAPSQPRAVWVPNGGGAAHPDSSPATPINQQPPQEQPQLQQRQQDQQQQTNPAAFVLGTWTQRQYIMPLQRPAKAPNGIADAEPAHASAVTSQRGSSSPARPIPKGKFPSSNGSSHSSGASIRAKAAPPAAHSSSGASSEAVPASAAQEAAAAAAAAEAAAGAQAGAVPLPIGDDAAAVAMWQAAADAHQQQRQQGQQQGRASLGTEEEEEEMVQQIAWRWRFARRWQAEQTRGPLDPAAAASPGDGGMEEALQYLAACGENWHHMSRESSHLGTMDSRLLGTLGSVGTLGGELLADDCGSFSLAHSVSGLQGALMQGTADSGGPLAASCCNSRGASMTGEGGGMQQLQVQLQQAQEEGLQPQQQAQPAQPQQRRRQRGRVQPRGEATVQVSGITRRAQQLLEAQNGINQAAQERWREVSAKQGTALWVGALLEGVQVDPWGKFKFLLLRIRDRNARQMLLVRGANNASEAAIVEELQKQVMAACSAHDLPCELIEVVGGGIMEWTQHRDRHLHISGGYVSRASGPGGPSSPTEVMRLAAVLTQQVLPMHYKVTSDAAPGHQ